MLKEMPKVLSLFSANPCNESHCWMILVNFFLHKKSARGVFSNKLTKLCNLDWIKSGVAFFQKFWRSLQIYRCSLELNREQAYNDIHWAVVIGIRKQKYGAMIKLSRTSSTWGISIANSNVMFKAKEFLLLQLSFLTANNFFSKMTRLWVPQIQLPNWKYLTSFMTRTKWYRAISSVVSFLLEWKNSVENIFHGKHWWSQLLAVVFPGKTCYYSWLLLLLPRFLDFHRLRFLKLLQNEALLFSIVRTVYQKLNDQISLSVF